MDLLQTVRQVFVSHVTCAAIANELQARTAMMEMPSVVTDARRTVAWSAGISALVAQKTALTHVRLSAETESKLDTRSATTAIRIMATVAVPVVRSNGRMCAKARPVARLNAQTSTIFNRGFEG